MWLNIWRVAVQMFYVAVVLVVFKLLHGRLETIVVALFGIVYVAIRWVGIGVVLMHRDFAFGIQTELDTIKAAVVPGFKNTHASEYGELKRKANMPIWFAWGGLSAISLICLINLFLAFGYEA